MIKLFTPTVRIAFALIGLLVVLATVASTFNYERSAIAAYNAEINYQGKLTNGSNVAVADGDYNMEFKLYDAVSGGSLLWTETRTAGDKVTVTNGVFSVMLGEVNPFGSLDFNQTLFLSVNIGGTGTPSWDGEMTPRKKIGTVPVAFLASNLKGTGLVDITNTATQAAFNYDGSNRATLGVASNGFTTLTSVGSGAGWNLTGGNVGIGTATTSAKLHVTSTTEQLRVGYDAANYSSFTTSSGGDLTIAPSGSDLAITGNVDVSGTLTSGTANAFSVNASGVVTAGAWQGTVVGSTYGGTGVNNGSNTITLGGNINTAAAFTTAGANALTLTTTGATNVTLPTTGTLITSGVTTLSSLVSIGTITTGVWNGTAIAGTYGGTGINTSASTGVPSISSGTWSVNAQLPVSLGGTGTANGSITGTGALSFTAGGAAQNVNLIATTTGSIVASSTTANTDTINIKPQTTGTGATFAGIFTTADLTGSDKTYTFPNANITVNAAADISGSTLAANVTASSLTSVGTLSSLALSGAITGATSFNGLVVTANNGTVTTGIWNGTDIAVADGGTGASTSQNAINNLSQLTTNGDLLYHNGTNSTRLARGSDTECLKANATTILWGACSAGGGYTTIQDEAGSLTQRATLNFTGAGVACVDNAGSTRTDCTIAGGGSTTFDTIGDAAGNGAVAMGTTVQTLDWGATTTTDNLTVTSSGTGLTSGSAFKVTSATTGSVSNGIVQLQASGAYTGSGGLLNLTANSTATGRLATFNATSLTTGKVIEINMGTVLTRGNAINVTGASYDPGATQTGSLVNLTYTNASTNASSESITNGLNLAITVNTSGAGTKQINGLNIEAPTMTACATGACTYAGLKITGASTTNVTSYGAYIDAGSGAGIEYAAAFMNGYVGIGTAAPTSMLQIGEAINRGDLDVYGDITTIGARNLTALAGVKDVFLYDTTADSDGGRWVDWATTERLSWYNETKDAVGSICNISTDDRCGASSFPRKATLAVTANALYIFDTSNNTLWMKFSQNASGYALGVDTSNDPSSVTAMNGVIYVGTTDGSNGAGDGLYAFDFINDRMWNYDATDRSGADVGIGSRNGAVNYNVDNNTNLDIAVTGTIAGWETINDVFVVNPNITITASTIGAATNLTPGYGGTYIALATNSGLTVINMATSQLIQYSDATDNDYTAVHLTKTGRMYALNTTLDQLERWDNFDADKINEINGAYSAVWDQSTTPALSKTTPNMIVGAPDAIDVIERASSALETEDLIYVGHSLGLTELHGHTTTATGWVKWFDTNRQSMMKHQYIDVALPLDDTTTTADSDTIVDNDMTYKGTYTQGVSGVRGKAVDLGGAGYLCSDTTSDGTCDVDTAFNISTVGWTVSMWFKHSTSLPGAPEVLFSKCYVAAGTAATGCVDATMTTTGTIRVGVDDDASWTLGTTYDITATTSQLYNDNQWHMITISRTNAGDVDVYLDGQAINLSTATALATTFDGSQIVSLGASCAGSVNCAAGSNFWNGSIDDFTFAVQTTTLATVSNAQQRRLFNDARPLVNKRVITVDNATAATSTTITDTGETWFPNEFAGLIVNLTSGTGAGQTRRVISNTTDTMTVAIPFDVTPDTTTDFEVDPEALYGDSNAVVAIGLTNKALLGEARLLCVGTDSTTGTGGVTCYNHQAGPNVIADIFHGDAKKTDDHGTEWTDTDSDSDDIRSIDLSKRSLLMATDEHMWSQAENVQLGQGLDYITNQLYNIRNELVLDGVTAVGSLGTEVGFTGGADLAEYYYSTNNLQAGDVVSIDPNGDGDDVVLYTGENNQRVLGVVASRPAIILGERLADGYPIALTGRIPVKFSDENGPVQPGDYLTASSIEGHAMRATSSGLAIGRALDSSLSAEQQEVCSIQTNNESEDLSNESTEESTSETEETTADADEVVEEPSVDLEMCGKVMMFVELGSFNGLPIEQLMEEMDAAIAEMGLEEMPDEDSVLLESGDLELRETKQDRILAFLKQMKTQKKDVGVSSQILTDRLSATFEVISPNIVADGLQVLTIGSSGRSIDVLSDLVFIGRPFFNSDTAGYAKILQGDRYVDVTFERSYLEQPIVSVAITQEQDEQLLEEVNQEVIDAMNIIDDSNIELLFGSNVQHLVTRKSQNGFRIILNQPAPQDLTFSWIALAVKNPRLVISAGDQIELDTGEVAGDQTDEYFYDDSSSDGSDSQPNDEPQVDESSDSTDSTGSSDQDEEPTDGGNNIDEPSTEPEEPSSTEEPSSDNSLGLE